MYRIDPSGVTRLSDGLSIRRGDVGWSDYLAWLAAGGVPAPPELAPPAPPELDPVPLYISAFQARAVLLEEGMLESVEAIVATDALQQLAWNRVTVFRRDSPTIALVAEALGLTSDQLDGLFRRGAMIKV